MSLHIFKTDIKTKKKAKIIKPYLNGHSTISSWSVDFEDIDNVLRIDASDTLTEIEIIQLLKSHGFFCEILPD